MTTEPGAATSSHPWLSEQRLRAALDGLLEGVNIFDAEVRYAYANPVALAQGRVRLEDVLGRRMRDVFPGVEQTEFHQVLSRICAGAPQQRLQTPFQFLDGSVGYFELFIEPLDGGGAFLLSVETTAQVLAERRLAESEARHRALLAGIPDLVFLLDSTGAVLDMHAPPAFPLLHPREALIGQPLTASLPPELAEATLDALVRVRASPEPVSLQYELRLSDGVRHFDATVVLGDQDHFTVVARDVTARVHREAPRRQAPKMEAIGQLTGGVAHDFNNVLAVISGNAELLAAMAEDEGQSVPTEVHEIVRATRRGAEMVSQLLQFSRRGALRRELVDTATVLTRVTTMLRRLLPESVTLQLGTMREGYTLSLDTGALEQIITNLCTNARDAMPGGGVITISCTIETPSGSSPDDDSSEPHEWQEAGPHFVISVRDTGAGMDEDTQRHVFEPFFTTKPVGVGTGLGLSMVYGLMKSHRGFVELESAPGKGTDVRLFFPLVPGPSAAEAESLPEAARAAPSGREGILLVEDDAAIRLATRRALEGKGYRVWEAADGALALECFQVRAREIALVVTDLGMPNMGGRQLADAIRARGSHVPILFTSGYAREWLHGAAGVPVGVRFLPKPWTLVDLFAQVREAIDAPSSSRD